MLFLLFSGSIYQEVEGTRWRNIFGLKSPYFIAEIGVNHGCSVSLAKKQILLAKKNGAHAVKFQSYKASTLASKNNSPAYWDLNKENTKSQN